MESRLRARSTSVLLTKQVNQRRNVVESRLRARSTSVLTKQVVFKLSSRTKPSDEQCRSLAGCPHPVTACSQAGGKHASS